MKTISQIAVEIGVTKQAVHKKIKREPLSTSLQQLMSINGNTVYVDVDGEVLIKSAFLKDKELKSTTKLNKVDDLVDDSTTKLVDSLQLQISLLTEQNNNLQSQLNIERKHNRDISDKLIEITHNTQILLKQEQDKNIFLLLDKNENSASITPESEPKEASVKQKKHWLWQFWKN